MTPPPPPPTPPHGPLIQFNGFLTADLSGPVYTKLLLVHTDRPLLQLAGTISRTPMTTPHGPLTQFNI